MKCSYCTVSNSNETQKWWTKFYRTIVSLTCLEVPLKKLRYCKLGGYPVIPLLFTCKYEILAKAPRHYSEDWKHSFLKYCFITAIITTAIIILTIPKRSCSQTLHFGIDKSQRKTGLLHKFWKIAILDFFSLSVEFLQVYATPKSFLKANKLEQ